MDEPDIPPLIIPENFIERVKKKLPELPQQRFSRYLQKYKISAQDAKTLVYKPTLGLYFEQILLAIAKPVKPALVANWVCTEFLRYYKSSNLGSEQDLLSPANFSELLSLVAEKKVSSLAAKKVIKVMIDTGFSATQTVDSLKLGLESDKGAVAKLIEKTLAENKEQLEEYLAGKEKLYDFFFGSTMKAGCGKLNPSIVHEQLQKTLKEKKNARKV